MDCTESHNAFPYDLPGGSLQKQRSKCSTKRKVTPEGSHFKPSIGKPSIGKQFVSNLGCEY